MRHPFWKSVLVGFPCITFVLLSPGVGHAEDEEDIWGVVHEISQLYSEFEYEQAFSLIQKARRLPRGEDGEVTLLMYEGILLCEMGRFEPARTAFHEALLLRPKVYLPENVAPKVEKEFEALQKRVAHEKSLLLQERMNASSSLQQEPVPLLSSADAPAAAASELEERIATASARDSLLARLLQLKEGLLKANGSSTLVPLRELVGIARQVRTAGTEMELQEAAQSMDAWEQQYAHP